MVRVHSTLRVLAAIQVCINCAPNANKKEQTSATKIDCTKLKLCKKKKKKLL